MHLVNILRIITFSCLERHSNFNNSDFNSFFWDTLYSTFVIVHVYPNPCTRGKKPEHPEKTHDFRQSVDGLFSRGPWVRSENRTHDLGGERHYNLVIDDYATVN
jgi:hypothetical protein